MITIDQDRCIACGTCVDICHQGCLSLEDDVLRIDRTFCSTCTQCIAVCPQAALSWDGVPPLPFDPARLPQPEQIEELLRQRRSIRRFTRDKIDRELLEKIIDVSACAPTNNYGMRAIAVDDPAIMKELDEAVIRSVRRLYSLLFKPRPVFYLMRKLTPAITVTDKVKMEHVLDRGFVLHSPAAIVFILGDKRIGLTEASAQYALYNMMLYAQAKGLGCCLWGNAPIILDRDRAVRARLRLGEHDHILGAVQMGYPAVEFANKVTGKRRPLQWIG